MCRSLGRFTLLFRVLVRVCLSLVRAWLTSGNGVTRDGDRVKRGDGGSLVYGEVRLGLTS
jgi:hypothetical protein